MNPKDMKPRDLLNEALLEVRNTAPDSVEVERAAGRVWARLAEVAASDSAAESPAPFLGALRSCSDYQALMPAYLAGTLTEGRRLLLEDHSRHCVLCFKTLRAARTAQPAPSSPAPHVQHRVLPFPAWRVAAVAVVLLGVGLTYRTGLFQSLIAPTEVRATAQAVDGTLFRISGAATESLTAGASIGRDQTIRTAKDSGAVLELADGTRIEMRERSELSLGRARDGVRIELARGSVIVQAAKQPRGHLYVATDDCTVSVVGTVFSVSEGSRGSRVSVIEGEVRVEHAGGARSIHPGQQISTHAALATVPIEQEIAWSRNLDAHLQLLKELAVVSQQISQMPGPALRYNSKLLNLVPPETLIYAAFPNVSTMLGQAYDLFRQRINENPVLKTWWEQQARTARPGQPTLEEMIARMRRVGNYLGAEITVAVPRGAGEMEAPVLMSEVGRPAELLAALQDDVARVNAASGKGALQIVRNPAELLAAVQRNSHEVLLVYADNTIVATSPSARQLLRVVNHLAMPGTNAFPASRFYARIAEVYRQGAGFVFAIDLEQLLAESNKLAPMGLGDVDQLIVEQRSVGAETTNRAVLSFGGERRGMMSWLAQPAAMGALDFVSPSAYGVGAVLTKDPSLMVDELFTMLRQMAPESWRELVNFQQIHRIDFKYDVAAALGGEFAFALDGPMLPSPAWKIVVEVYDAPRLQRTIEFAISEINRELALKQQPHLRLSSEVAGGRTFYKISVEGVPYEIHYTYWDGYLIMAPNRVLLTQALTYKASGSTLSRSEAFRARLPLDGRDHASAVFYQNMASAVASVADLGARISGTQAQQFREIAAIAGPSLIAVYGERDQIVFATNGRSGLNFATMMGFGSLMEQVVNAGGTKRQ